MRLTPWIGECPDCGADSQPDQNGFICGGHGLHYEDCVHEPRWNDEDELPVDRFFDCDGYDRLRDEGIL